MLRALVTSRWTRAAFLLLAVVLLLVASAGRLDDIRLTLRTIGWSRLSLAGLLGMAAIAVQAPSWRAAVRGFGGDLSHTQAARTYSASLVGKYVPGGVWSTVMLAEHGAEQEVPRRVSVAASLVAVGVGVVTGALIGLAFLPAGMRETDTWAWWALLAAPIVAAVLHPRVLNRLVNTTLARLQREPLPREITGRWILAAAGWSTASWLLLGLHIAVMVGGVSGDHSQLIAFSVGTAALAWTVGVLVVVAPAGAGARDLVLAALLATRMDESAAIAITLASRAVLTLVDLALGGAALALRIRRHRTDSPDVPIR
jgi:uncharacterized membrane protein YbhN (UPF0104 family)